MSVNLVLFGLTGPFAAAAMLRFGVRRVFLLALSCCAAGSALTVGMTAAWQLVLFTGVLTAASATGQLVFLPLLAALVTASGWRSASLAVSIAALRADVAARRPSGGGPAGLTPDASPRPPQTRANPLVIVGEYGTDIRAQVAMDHRARRAATPAVNAGKTKAPPLLVFSDLCSVSRPEEHP